MEKSKNKIIIPFSIGIIAFICFALVYGAIVYTAINITKFSLLGLVFLVPALVYFLFCILTKKKIMKPKLTNILSFTLVPVFVVSSFFGLVYIGFDAIMEGTDNPGLYSRAMSRSSYKNTSEYQPFPLELSADQKNVNFYFHPRFMQGGETLMLSFNATDEIIDEYEADLIANSTWHGTQTQVDRQSINLEIYGTMAKKYPLSKLPKDFTYYVLHGNGKFSNHGSVLFAAISTEKNQLVLQYESW